MPRVTNPYIAGPALTAEMPFFGREDVFRFVRETLSSPHQNVIVLFGQRRIGKTSLLHHLPAHLPEGFHAVHFDLMGKAGQPLPEVLYELARTVARSLDLSDPKKASFYRDLSSFRDRFLPQVYKRLGDKRLILLFDEFDVLGDEPPPPGAAARTLIPYLLNLFQDQRRLVSVFVVGRRLEELPSRFKPLFKGAPYKRVSLLGYEDAVALVREPAIGTLAYTGEAIDHILHFTACHPYFTQLVCFELFNTMQRAGRSTVTTADVDAVVDLAIERGTGGLTWFWDGFGPAERFVLSAVAAAADESGVTTFTGLQDVLRQQGIYLGDVDLSTTLGVLVEWEILESPADGSYRFTVEIVRRWVRAAHPLEQARSDIDYVVERAVRHFKSARGAHLEGDLEFAIEEYRRALAANPNYARAQRGLAQALYEMGRLEEALSEYQKAYQLDPHHARDGFAETAYKLGLRYQESRDWEQVIKYFTRANELVPGYKDVEEKLEETRKDLKFAQSYLAGISALKKRQWTEAIVHLELPAQGSYRDAAGRLREARSELGRHLLAEKKFEEAIRVFELLAEENHPGAIEKLREAYEELGQQLLAKEDFDGAQECFEKAGDNAGVEEAQKRKQRVKWFQSAQEALEIAKEFYAQGYMDLMEGGAREAARLFKLIHSEEPGYRDGIVYEGLKQAQQLLLQIELWNQLSKAWKTSNFSDVLIYGDQILDDVPVYKQIFDSRYREVVAKCRHARKQLRGPTPSRRVPGWFIWWIDMAALWFVAALLLLRNVERGLLEFALPVLAAAMVLIVGAVAFILWNVGGLTRDRLQRLAKTWGMMLSSPVVGVLLGSFLLVGWNRYQEVRATANVTSTAATQVTAMASMPASFTPLPGDTPTIIITPTRTLIATPGATLCNGDFETGDFTCWIRDGELDVSVTSLTESKVALLGNPDYNCKGGVPIGSAMLSQQVIVPTEGKPALALRYRIHSNDVLDKDKYDSFEIYVNDKQILLDGNTDWSAAGCDRKSWDSGWREFAYPLDDFKGKTITLSLRNFNRVRKWYNTWTYVDDVEITP